MKNIDTFRQLPLPRPLLSSLAKMRFNEPTPIQSKTIPAALKGTDILGIAQTGTGKTAAFGIPLLSRVYTNPGKTALILAPTRELAAQINKVLRQMSKQLKLRGSLVVGGESFGRQVRELDRGVDFIVATPGRLNDHLQERTVRLSKVSFLVLDEVDRMLDMGFAPQIRKIIKHLPKKRQTLLFSATLPKEAAEIVPRLLSDPLKIKIDSSSDTLSKIEEITLKTSHQEKMPLVVSKLAEKSGKTLIFTRTKNRTEKVARALGKNGHKVVNLHGGRTQGQRKRALNMFRSGSHPIMVATDIAGRGIDVVDIETVVNFDLPQSREDYIHRIGRTARNGRAGTALNLLTPDDGNFELILTGKTSAKTKSKPRSSGRKRPSKRRFKKTGGRRKKTGRFSR